MTVAYAVLAWAPAGALPPPGWASCSAWSNASGARSPAEANAKLAEGTVKKIDKSAGKLTIAHGPLESLGMPAMTMVFRAAEPGMLDQVKAGDKIRFAVEKVGGALTVTSLEPAQ